MQYLEALSVLDHSLTVRKSITDFAHFNSTVSHMMPWSSIVHFERFKLLKRVMLHHQYILSSTLYQILGIQYFLITLLPNTNTTACGKSNTNSTSVMACE